MTPVSRTRKILAKSLFQSNRNELRDLVDQRASHDEVRTKLDELSERMEEYLLTTEDLERYFQSHGEVDKIAHLHAEIDGVEKEFVQIYQQAKGYMMSDTERRARNPLKRTLAEELRREISSQKEEIEQLASELEKSFSKIREEFVNVFTAEPDAEKKTSTKNHRPPTSTALPGENIQQPLSLIRPMLSTLQPEMNRHIVNQEQPQGTQEHRRTSLPADRSANDASSLSLDSTKLLQRISIPKFSGERKIYESWKAAFLSCIDRTTATTEYKILHLHNSLEGEALEAIQNLGYSPAAYNVALERLERKYGGKKRQIMVRMEELDNFRPIHDGSPRDVEKLAELIDVLVVNLEDAGLYNELGYGSVYITLQRKLSEGMLTRYFRWVHDTQNVYRHYDTSSTKSLNT